MRHLPNVLKLLTAIGTMFCYWLGTHQASWLVMGLVIIFQWGMLALAVRFDYVLHLTKPEDLKTWTLRALMNAIYDWTDGRYSDHTAIYVEGDAAYHPIEGAFLAQIGTTPAIVLQPKRGADAE